jgi:hypothetical protein
MISYTITLKGMKELTLATFNRSQAGTNKNGEVLGMESSP